MDYRQLLKFFLKKIKRDNISAYAAQAALFMILSAIPFLLVLTSLIRFTPIRERVLLDSIEMTAPGYLSPLLIGIADEVYHSAAGFLPAAVLAAVYSAAKTIQSLREGLNRVYDVKENRSWLTLRLRAMAETVLLILSVLFLLLLLVFGQKIHRMLLLYAPAAAAVTGVLLKFRMVILFFSLIFFFAFIYKMLPNRRAVFFSQLFGAAGCSAAWYIFSFGLSVYINYFHGFSLYGSLTAIVLLMFWLYIGLYIFLVCGEANNAFEIVWLKIQTKRKKQRVAKKEKRNDSDF